MDPLSAMIGGASSLIGGFMNTSSQQAINTANLQQAQWSAQGGYLPGLVMNATKAGINPLAVLGQHAPNTSVYAGSPAAGEGVAAAGKFLSQMKDPHQLEMERQQVQAGQLAMVRSATEISNAEIAGRIQSLIANRMASDSSYTPEGGTNWYEAVKPLSDRLNVWRDEANKMGQSFRGSLADSWKSIQDAFWHPGGFMQ